MHLATLPTGIIGYLGNPLTTVKPSGYKLNDLDTLIHSVVLTYHLEINTPIIFHYQDIKRRNIFFEVNFIDLYRGPIINNTVCTVKPSQRIAPRVLPPLEYSKGKLQFMKKFVFQYSDLENSDQIQLCNFLVQKLSCVTLGIVVGKTSTLFRIRLKPYAKLQTQRANKVPVHYGFKLNAFLYDIKKTTYKTNCVYASWATKIVEQILWIYW